MARSSDYFRDGGILSERIPSFRYRPCQEGMAELVEEALDNSEHAVIEAGTGTGKSYAYIVPLLLRAKERLGKEIIATSTLPLMNQLLSADIPAMQNALGTAFNVAALYGRSNYLCILRWDYLWHEKKDDASVRRFSEWVDDTEIGLKEEIRDPGLFQVFSEVSAERESCIGRFCPFISQCFYYKARKDAENADIIVTNHHVVLADIMLRREKGAKDDETVLLPPFDAMAIDEAHNFPDGATDTFTSLFSTKDVKRALKMIAERRAGKSQNIIDALSPCLKDRSYYGEINSAIAEIKEFSAQFDKALPDILRMAGNGNDKFYFSPSFYEEGRFRLREFLAFSDRLTELGSMLVNAYAADENASEETWGDMVTLSMAAEMLAELGTLLGSWIEFEHPADEIPYAYTEGSNTYIAFAPMDTGAILAQSLLDNDSSIIFSSATLSVGDSFSFFASQVGLDRCETGYVSQRFPTAFDLKSNLLCIIAGDGQRYSNEYKSEWEKSIAQPIADAIRASGGGALVLFTARSSMEKVYPEVRELLPDMHIMMQESGKSRNMILEAFKEDEDSSLFALSSFWEGIDAPGDTLRLLIIPKLPYPVPTDPIIAARGIRQQEISGKSPFISQQVPLCALKMKQGVGRVIRGESDRGAAVILDSRILSPMSRNVLSSLPDCHMEKRVPLSAIPDMLSSFFSRK